MNENSEAPRALTEEELAAIKVRCAAAMWREVDAEFIAHAREDVPRLLATVEQLRSRLRTIDVELDYAGAPMGPMDGSGVYTADGRVIAMGLEMARLREELAVARAATLGKEPVERTPKTVLRAMLKAYERAALEASVAAWRNADDDGAVEREEVLIARVGSLRQATAKAIAAEHDPLSMLSRQTRADYEARLSGAIPLNAPPTEQ